MDNENTKSSTSARLKRKQIIQQKRMNATCIQQKHPEKKRRNCTPLANVTDIDVEIVRTLTEMLDKYNVHCKYFRMARDRYAEQPFHDLKLRLIADRQKDGRIYNMPMVLEVVALIVGDVDNASPRDIIMESKTGKLQRINELHTSYLGYQYPLLFPYGEDGYRHDISHCDSLASKCNRLTIREWFCFRIQTRDCKAMAILRSRRIFQQFGYTMIESERLSFIRNNQ